MATAAIGDNKSLTQMVECDICMEIMKTPQALLCLHHFCLECINKLNRIKEDGISGVACPYCRKFTPVNFIQDSFMMNNLIEMYYKQQQHDEDELFAENCKSAERLCMQCDKLEGKHICSDCHMELCQVCKDTHLRIPSCRDHTVLEIGSNTNSSSNEVNAVKYCGNHPESIIKYSCVPCNKAICMECKIESHDTHKTETIDAALNRLTKQAKVQMEEINNLNEQVKYKLTKVKATKESIFRNIENTKQHIHAKSESLIAKIEHDTNELVEEMESQSSATLKELGIIEEHLQNKLASQESLQSWGNTVINMNQGPGLLCELQEGLLQKMELCATELRLMECSGKYEPKMLNIHFLPAEYSSNMIGSLNDRTGTNEGRNTGSTPEILIQLQDIKFQEKQHEHKMGTRQMQPPQNVQRGRRTLLRESHDGDPNEEAKPSQNVQRGRITLFRESHDGDPNEESQPPQNVQRRRRTLFRESHDGDPNEEVKPPQNVQRGRRTLFRESHGGDPNEEAEPRIQSPTELPRKGFPENRHSFQSNNVISIPIQRLVRKSQEGQSKEKSQIQLKNVTSIPMQRLLKKSQQGESKEESTSPGVKTSRLGPQGRRASGESNERNNCSDYF